MGNDGPDNEMRFLAPYATFAVRADTDTVDVRVAGEIDASASDVLAETVEAIDEFLRRDGLRRVVVDMADVDFCDATGAAFLLRARRRTASRQATFAVRPSASVRRLLAAAMLEDLIPDA